MRWLVVLTMVGTSGCGGEPSSTAPDGALPDAVPATPAPLALPLEVIGPPGTTVDLVFELSEADLAAASDGLPLAVTIHNVVEAEACELELNGTWRYDLADAAGGLLRARGDVTRGVIVLPASALVAGRNQATLRYTRQVPNVSGFRLLAVELTAASGPVPLETIGAPPPITLRTDDDALAAGKAYFTEISRDGGPVCATCHTPLGEDLAYFQFSDHSIVERAMFHEFSRDEAVDIASYLASLDVPRLGTVYDPPFQPGPGAIGSAGAGHAAVVADDDAFAAQLGTTLALTAPVAWDWASTVDTYALPAALPFPTWFRWLPREIDPTWFTRNDGEFAAAELALRTEPTLANAQRFEALAVAMGKRIMVFEHSHEKRVELLRYAAVRLWNWSRGQGFDDPDHGLPDGTPAYPYEIGFAFFEAAKEHQGLPEGDAQVMQWWWLQLALDPGRGLANGRRPLNFADVQVAADAAGLGPAQQAFLHLLGTYEESRGAMAAAFGTDAGPVRLLATPMLTLPGAQRAEIMRRFLVQEAAWLAGGGTLDDNHHAALRAAWAAGCDGLTAEARTELRNLAPAEVVPDLAACPAP